MNVKKFLEENPECKAIGEYKNSFGEVFLAYRVPNTDQIFITGDELDWEKNVWIWLNGIIAQVFLASEDEIKGLGKIIKENR